MSRVSAMSQPSRLLSAKLAYGGDESETRQFKMASMGSCAGDFLRWWLDLRPAVLCSSVARLPETDRRWDINSFLGAARVPLRGHLLRVSHRRQTRASLLATPRACGRCRRRCVCSRPACIATCDPHHLPGVGLERGRRRCSGGTGRVPIPRARPVAAVGHVRPVADGGF